MARKILLADDSVTAQNMGRKILADAGYEVLTVNNGSAALKKVADSKPDLIVLDVYMPGYSGLEVCQRLKEARETARIPVLLTVGKLEPFKPEEAKRARADGFIVKPFEASELLSVLTKLEDKIVPHAENSKPGRFARAIAAVEEGRYDKTTSGEDAGWKDRLGFPSKKRNAEPEDVDDPAIYNPINKDLRTILDRKTAPAGASAKAEAAKVDVGALAPEGLPKDVTPEEIAALAAAAAQIKGTTALSDQEDDRAAESRDGAVSAPRDAAAVAASGSQVESKAETISAISETMAGSLEKPAEQEKPGGEEGKQDWEKIEAAKRAAEMPVASSLDCSTSANGAETRLAEPATFLAADSPAAEPQGDRGADSSDSFSHAAVAEPVTMAAAAGAGSTSSRWIAVSTALLPEESTISLENEMQKAHAAFAAAEVAQVSTDSPSASIAWAPTTAIETPSAVDSDALTAKASETAESISAVVRELEARASALLSEQGISNGDLSYLKPAEIAKSSESELAIHSKVESAEGAVAEAVSMSSAVASEHEAGASAGAESSPAAEVLAGAVSSEAEDLKPAKSGIAAAGFEEAASSEQVASASGTPSAEASEAAEGASLEQNAVRGERTIEDTANKALSSEASTSEAVPTINDQAASNTSSKEETSVSNSWRQIRDLADPSAHAPAKDDTINSKDSSAMAVAAGAEHAPHDVPANSESEDPTEIANIVDSVLADLRPRIVAEISKKMGKRK